MTARRLFTPADLEAIRAEVGAAEGATAGEIVPYVVARSDDYPEAGARGALFGSLGLLFAAAAFHRLEGGWGGSLLFWALLPAAVGAFAGWLLPLVPTVRRLLVADATLEARVRTAAEAAFLEQEVFATRDRTGILLFVSLLEHRVVVLGDAGISSAVAPEEWQGISDALAAGIRRGEAPTALREAVAACGRLLAERVPRAPDDRDELGDHVRFGDGPGGGA